MARALLVGLTGSDREVITTALDEAQFDYAEVTDWDDAIEHLQRHRADLVLAAVPEQAALIGEIVTGRKKRPPVLVLVVDEPAAALEVIDAGVSDFLSPPVDRRRLRFILGQAHRLARLGQDLDSSRDQLRRLGRFGRFVGSSQPMQRVYDRIARVGPSDATVFVSGESGVGKEIVAETIHALSERRDGPFVAVNCGAIASELLESELFGHEKGAFTGADRQHRGWFERADGGTLLLDEITEMPAASQVNLLRVLETGRVRRVGSEESIAVDVRILAATNQNLEEAVEQGALREDLYYRLKVFQIWVPPLRDRGADVELLARFFLDEECARTGSQTSLTADAVAKLSAYAWPGNVRELRNAIRSAALLADDCIDADDLPAEIRGAVPADQPASSMLRVRVGTPIAEVERRLILATLDHCGGNRTQAAEALGISVKTLYNRLTAYEQADA